MGDEIYYKTLEKYFGFRKFRKGQLDVIKGVAEKRDALVVMPTGGGKSLCYQLPALLTNGTALVLSPLIALMKNQVDSLNKARIPATFINSSLTYPEVNERIRNAGEGRYKLLYIAPERLKNRNFIRALNEIEVSFLAVDEAHCISEWGHDFRPSYLYIKDALRFLENLSIVALTATATPDVQEDIVNSLEMKNPLKIVRGFDRPNLSYITETTENKLERIVDILHKTPKGSSIIYCGSRKKVERYTESLRGFGIDAHSYHAGMPSNFRKYVQERFLNENNSIIAATSAFGMGIDKPETRNVIHCDLTQTLDSYYQEAGRAGRDGEPANCYLLYLPSDRKLQEFFIETTYPRKSVVTKIYDVIYDAASAGVGEKPYESIKLGEAEIANRAGTSLFAARSVISLLERSDIIRRGSTNGVGELKFVTNRERLVDYFNSAPEKRKNVLEALLRGVSAEAFNSSVEFDVNHLTRKYMINLVDLKSGLKAFEIARLIKCKLPGVSKGITFLTERRPSDRIPIDFKALNMRRNRAVNKLNVVQEYAETSECKRNFILRYFQDPDAGGDCGRCSSCLSEPTKDESFEKKKYCEKEIMTAVAKLNGKYGRTTIADFLRGARTQKTMRLKLDKIEGFGVLKNFGKKELIKYIDAAIALGKIDKIGIKRPVLEISDFYSRDPELGDILNEKSERKEISPRPQKCLNLANEGYSLKTIAKKTKTTETETAKLLQEAIEKGGRININLICSTELFHKVKKAVTENPNIALRELRTALNSKIDYSALRVVLAKARREVEGR